MMRRLAGAAAPTVGGYDADVVILALDRAAETVAAIQSALAQTGVSRHVFVIDQGSAPANLALLTDFVTGRPDVTLLATWCNHGVPGGRNRGAALGHGRVIVGLDNDAVFAGNDALAGMVAALDADPALGAIGCRIVLHATGADDLSSWGYPLSLLPQAGGSFEATTFVGAGHAIRRTAWNQVGGYDEALFFCWEEYDFALRAAALGWRIRYRGDLVVRHKVAAARRIAWSGQRWFYHVRNRLYIGRKYGRSWLALMPRIAGYLLKGLCNGLPWTTLRGIAGAHHMAADVRVQRLAPALWRRDAAARGGWLRRLRQDVLARLPAASGGGLGSPNGLAGRPAAQQQETAGQGTE